MSTNILELKEEVFSNRTKKEAYFHSLLTHLKGIKIGNSLANEKIREILNKYGNFEEYYKIKFGFFKAEIDEKFENKLLNSIKESNFNLLTIHDKNFPKSLKEDSTLTPLIYTSGNLDLLNKKSMGFVGTRGSLKLEKSQELTTNEEKFGKIAAKRVASNYTITSGIAIGSDSIGHIEALKTHNSTIGVIAKPINEIYSKINQKLQERIQNEGLLVSEYPFCSPFFSSYLSNRNKTTVALSSEGIVVLYAGDKSGTIHAIKEAYRVGKPIYVIEELIDQNCSWIEKYQDKIKLFKAEK